MQYLKAFAATLATYLVVDGLWLTFAAAPLFKSELAGLLRAEPNLAAAAAFYLIYAGGATWLAVLPALEANSLRAAASRGAVLGLTAYATFELTSLAIIQGWSVLVALVDTLWGAVVTTVAAVAGFQAARPRATG